MQSAKEFLTNGDTMIYLPEGLPALAELWQEGCPACGYDLHQPRFFEAWAKNIKAGTLRVLLLNLMPEKQQTESDIAHVVAATGHDVLLIPVKFSGQQYKNTSPGHMARFYLDTETVEGESFDGLIVTGAPLEHLDFAEVRYWPQLCRIMDWAVAHVGHTLYICWAAQAALFHFYGIPKRMLPRKMFGIFSQEVQPCSTPLTEGLGPVFPMPVSRHSEVSATDLAACGGGQLTTMATSGESGVGIVCDASRRCVYVTGHLEYNRYTLHNEYQRDVNKGIPIDAPRHYYAESPEGRRMDWTWHPAAVRFYANWLDLCAQTMPRTQ